MVSGKKCRHPRRAWQLLTSAHKKICQNQHIRVYTKTTVLSPAVPQANNFSSRRLNHPSPK